ncbi:MAG: PKD domain-containing protein [Anaerolineae bacterium]|nr:PKD domain-containing protein [Anaerolineae bacterium]
MGNNGLLAGGLVEELARRSGTNMLGGGTTITGLHNGIVSYLTAHHLRQGYVITKVNKPEFWWVAEEVERSEDVILLLGFYAMSGLGAYERIGGHYVALSGVDKQGGFVALSDPYWDRIEDKLPPREFQRYPRWSGRTGSDGDAPLGPTKLLPTYTHVITHSGVYTLHNDAANVSHDVYRVISTDSPGGTWGPEGYVNMTDEITNFFGLNGPTTIPLLPDVPVQTKVEWALVISPVADLGVTKSVVPAVVAPGGWVTFTIAYTNYGNLAEDVVITDLIPSRLIHPHVVGTWNNYGGIIITHDTFTWTVGDVPLMGRGIITVAAQVDPTQDWPDGTVVTNTVEIATMTTEQYQVPARPNSASAAFTVHSADVSIVKTTPLIWISAPRPGDWLTFTLAYANVGPVPASSVVITDLLPTPPLTATGARYTYANNYGGVLAAIPGLTFAWSAGDLPPSASGVITIAAQVDPHLAHGGSFTNTAEIATTTSDRDPSNNRSDFHFPICVPPARASFTYTPAIPVVNLPITFTGSVARGEPVDYAWDFGDPSAPGPSPTGNPVTHTYTAPGFYTVWMTATSRLPLCGQDTYSETIFVCRPLTSVGIERTPLSPLVGETVRFAAKGTGSEPITYTWGADDGWSASGPTATHAFATRGLHTVWLTATNRCSQVYTETTIFVREYGVDLQPDRGGTFGNPGKTVVYTLTLYNTGNVTDMYTIAGAVSGQPWTTTWPMLSIGPMAGGAAREFNVSVEIPPDAADGHWSRVVITAISLNDGSKHDTSVLTTTATTQVITRGVAVAPRTAAKAGRAGETVTYTLRVTNTGTVPDLVNLSYTNAGTWTVSFSANPLSLNAGAGQDVKVYVGIPSGIVGTATRTITVTATSQGDPTKRDRAILTTSVLGRFIYLPLVMRHF